MSPQDLASALTTPRVGSRVIADRGAPDDRRPALAFKIGAEALLLRAHANVNTKRLKTPLPAGKSTGQGNRLDGPFDPTAPAETGPSSARLLQHPIYGGSPEVKLDPPDVEQIAVQRERTAIEEGDLASRHLRLFLARAQRQGARSLPHLIRTFYGSAIEHGGDKEGSGGGEAFLDEAAFERACGKVPLPFKAFECRCIYHGLKRVAGCAPGDQSFLRAGDIVSTIIGSLSQERAAAVEEAWQRVAPPSPSPSPSPPDFGMVAASATVATLEDVLKRLDVRRLPEVLSGQVTMAVAKREILEGLDLANERMDEATRFSLEEAYYKRRPFPVGVLSVPRNVPAGRPRNSHSARSQNDVQKEISEREPLIRPNGTVTYEHFKAYHTFLSTTMQEDSVFFRTVANAWCHDRPDFEAWRASCTPRY